jgi:hypothetical protein
MRLPGETSEEFVLMLPFKTRSGTTLTAWLAARCDDPHYGQLRLYRFPAEMQTDTPEQADKTIRADVTVSKEITLLSEAGSEVLYGNFLVLPVGQSVLYVKPMFVGATQSEMEGRSTGIPALKNVILAEKRGEDLTVVMRPTLDESLAALVGSSPVPARTAAPARSAAPGAVAPGVAALAAEAEAAFETADRALRSGDWAEYGRQIGRAREALRRIRARGE